MAWHDDQYLFRLTSTFGWDDAISLCDSLVSGIETSASRRGNRGGGVGGSSFSGKELDDEEECNCHIDYFNDSLGLQPPTAKTLQQWLRHAHTQLFCLDQWGNCPLHAACYVKPPLNMIEALFRVGRALWANGPQFRGHHSPIWEVVCTDGSTPFLIACSTGASTSVIHAYLNEIEFYIQQKWVDDPHYSRMLVVRPDNQGTSPLIGWMNFHYSWIRRQMEQDSASRVNLDSQSHHYLPRRTGERPSLSDYWSLACRILLFATMNIRPHGPPSTPVLVHRCASIATCCPVSLLDWVVSPRRDYSGWAPADESAATEDNRGRLPMHRAFEALDSSSIFNEYCVRQGAATDAEDTKDVISCCENSTEISLAAKLASATIDTTNTVHHNTDTILYNNPKLEINRLQIITKLLLWYPQAAKIPFSNGRPPLFQAIAHGGTWHCSDPDNDNAGVLQVLWGLAPEQLLDSDPITGLYPFQLAATLCSGQNNEGGNERAHVETVYNLLRKDPQLVAGALVISS